MALSTRARVIAISLIAMIVATFAFPVSAEDVTEVFPETSPDAATAASAAQTDLWFVELGSAPTADGTSLGTVRAEKDAFRRAAKAAGIVYAERRSFDVLWNGLAIQIDASQVSKLARVNGVANVWPVAEIALPQPGPDEGAELATAVAQTGADLAQAAGWTGAGVKVAVMDTGVDYDHPDLGGCFGPACRVTTGWDFVGDDFAGPNTPVPDPLPDDCNGHGTHVAGIVGANGEVTGVAPGVTFGSYRVFGCEGFTTADIMIAAMERALADGMHVLNMSIGSAFQTWPNYPTAAASDRAVNKGMVVVASIGNSGASGVYSAGAPGVGKKVIGVASFDNTHIELRTFTITPDDMPIGYQQATASPTAPTSGSSPMSRTGTSSSAADACNPLPAGSLSGTVALIRRGTCTFHQKSLNAQNAGAIGVVLYNNATGRFAATVAGTPAITIPVVSISNTEGNLIDSRLATGPVTMTWTDQTGTFVNPTGNLISSFSSYGLAADLSLKPDIGAPGGLIRSTWPLEKGGYATISGTSMSSPHVAGGVALLLQAHPGTNANSVRSILQNSADPKVWGGNPGLGFLDNVHRQGAGMLDIDDAIVATTSIEPGKLALGESQAGPSTSTLTLSNTGSTAVTYDLSRVNALSTSGNTNAPSFNTSNAAATFSQAGVPVTSVTVPAGGTTTVDVMITAATGPNRAQYGGYLVFTPQGGGQTYRVPFAGFVGDYQSIVAITPTTCPVALPAIGEKGTSRFCGVTSDVPFTLPAADLTFTLADGDVPYIVFHLDHQVRRVRVEAIDAAGNVGKVGDFNYLGRNPSNGYFWVTWDGETQNGKKIETVPNGQYQLRLTVLKALGDATDPAHSETWTSPTITIARP
jgi:minor extracellular serine protease Vpr